MGRAVPQLIFIGLGMQRVTLDSQPQEDLGSRKFEQGPL